jgi:hypothetical protein
VAAATPADAFTAEPKLTAAPTMDRAVADEPRLKPAPAMEDPIAPVAEAPGEKAVEGPAAIAAEPEDTISYLRDVARAAKVDPETDKPHAGPKQVGGIRRRVMQFLLWTVEVEGEPEHYTLGQVLKLVGRSLGSGFALIVSPITRPFVHRFHRTREDWRISGEVVQRQKARKSKATAKPSKVRR